MLNQVLEAQATEQVPAKPYECYEERLGYKNGHRARALNTRVGRLVLLVPRLRRGEFSPELFRRSQRSKKALLLAMVEMVVKGVSTRKVPAVLEELCGTEFSKSTVSELCKSMDAVVRHWNEWVLSGPHYPLLLVDALVIRDARPPGSSSRACLGPRRQTGKVIAMSLDL